MRILFIKPYWPYPYSKGDHTYNRIWPPLELANCASIIEKQGHEAKIIDAHALRIQPQNIRKYCQGFDKIFITSSSLDRWICPNINLIPFLDTLKEIRGVSKEIFIMGYHGTSDPQNFLQMTQATAVIRGEPEYTVADICSKKDWREAKGISYLSNGKLVSNTGDGLQDSASFPIPAYHLLNVNKYFYEILGGNFMLFEITRGCAYSCKFCIKQMFPTKIVSKPAQNIIAELTEAIEKHNIKNGYFIDLEFMVNKDIVKEICNYLISKKYNFRWCCQMRPDSVQEDVLREMKAAGCTLIHFGIESGLQKILDYTNKGSSIENIRTAVKMCKNAGIETMAFYIFGIENETQEDRKESFEFAKKLDTEYVSFHPYFSYDNLLKCVSRQQNESLNYFIREKYFQYYLRFNNLKRINPVKAWKCGRLFLGRLLSL